MTSRLIGVMLSNSQVRALCFRSHDHLLPRLLMTQVTITHPQALQVATYSQPEVPQESGGSLTLSVEVQLMCSITPADRAKIQ